MKYVPLDSAHAVYNCARIATIESHHVDDVAFHRYCFSLREFEKSLGESVGDGYWKPFLRALKRYRFDMSATPLPFNYFLDQSPSSVERLRKQLAHCEQIFPQFAESARELVNWLFEVQGSCSRPIWEACADIIGNGGSNVAILLKESRHIPMVERVLHEEFGSAAVEIIGSHQLTGHICYSTLIVIGPSYWHGDYVLQSPRARRIHIVKYSWINDPVPTSKVFIGSWEDQVAARAGQWLAKSEGKKEVFSSPTGSFDPEEFLPSVNWEEVLRMVSARTAYNTVREDGDEETVTARLIELEGEIVVPLDASESSMATVLFLDQEEHDPVKSLPVTSIEPGMFLLVRSGGGGEYIAIVADRLLGERSVDAREIQRNWKDQLRRKVRLIGLSQVILDLKKHGSRRANQANVRNWMSYRSIKTKDTDDFRAILRVIGLADSFEDTWKEMILIDSAHRRAGRLISQQLLSVVRKADLQRLEKIGKMDFELPGMEGVNLTAVRITSVHPQTVEVGVARLGHQIKMDGNIWPG